MRRSLLWFAWMLAALAVARAQGDDQAIARAVLDQAIEFAGGKEVLAKYDGPIECVVKFKSFFVQQSGGATKSVVQEASVRTTTWFPDRYRQEPESTVKGKKNTSCAVFNGEKGWLKTQKGFFGNMPPPPLVWEPANAAGIASMRKMLYRQALTTLAPLRGADFQLATVDEIELENRPAVGVMVSKKDHADVRLYFDKETFALVKLAQQLDDKDATAIYEEYFDDYTQLDDLVYPKKSVVFTRGAKLHEKEITELKFIEPPAEDFFAPW